MVVGTRVAIFSSLFGLFSSLLGANTQSIRQGWQGCVCERERESRAGDSGRRICVERGDGGGGGGSTAREG